MRISNRIAKVAFLVVARAALFCLLTASGPLAHPTHAARPPVFHLDFSAKEDATGNMATQWGDQVSLVPRVGPMVGGVNLDAGNWAGDEATPETNQVLIKEQAILDAVSVGSGSIVSWIRPENSDDWNTIVKTKNFPEVPGNVGIELHASGPWAGVFGGVQGWLPGQSFSPSMPATPVFPMGATDTLGGQWTHAAMTWEVVEVDGTKTATAITYVDGIPGSLLVVSPFENNAVGLGDWSIGGEDFASRDVNSDRLRILQGDLADFAIYDVALTQQEIEEIIESGVALPTTALWAGDADMNLAFDQFDVIKVQQTAKYRTGEPATWGEGDWNGAPGGSVDAPPPGNGLFDQFDIIASQIPGHYRTGPYAALPRGGQYDDAQTSVVYDSNTGELSVDAPAGGELTSINIDSASGIFTGDAAGNLGGSFDHDADDNLFKATFGSSFGSLSFGNVVQVGLSEEFMLGDLTVVGSIAGGGSLGEVDLIYIPEPSALFLAIFGFVGLLGRRRRPA